MQVILNIPDDLIYSAGRYMHSPLPLEQMVVTALRAHIGGPAYAMYLKMPRREMLVLAMQRLEELPVGATFMLRALLVDQAWDALSDGDKRQLGKEIKAEALESGLVELLEENSAGVLYRRVEP